MKKVTLTEFLISATLVGFLACVMAVMMKSRPTHTSNPRKVTIQHSTSNNAEVVTFRIEPRLGSNQNK